MLNPGNEQLPIVEELVGSIGVLRFCLPAQKNALSTPTLNSLTESLTRFKDNSSLRVVIFTGTDDVFLSGADIRELSTLDVARAKTFSESGQGLTQTVADLPAVTIAAINGYCLGGGLDFALACDIRIASKSAVFAHPGSRLGIITGWGGTQRLPRLIGRTKAIELFSTAGRFSSDEALRFGLVTQIADPVLPAAMVLANELVSTS
jgi:enoyl-CoA hydratase